MTPLALVVGYIAGALGLVNAVPQAVKVWKSRSDEGVNAVSWVLGLITVSGWLAYGVRISNPTTIAANVGVVCTTGMVLLAIQRARGVRLQVAAPLLVLLSAASIGVAFVLPLPVLTTFFIVMSAIPWMQATTSWRTLRQGTASYVSIPTLTLRLASSLLWVWHGAMIDNWTIMSTAFIGSSATILTIAMETLAARRQRVALAAA